MRLLIASGIMALLIFSSSCEELLEVADISEDSVELLAPSDSSKVVQTDVNFTWNEVFEATQYHVQVAAPNFESPAQIVIDTLIYTDSTYIGPKFTKSLVDSAYEWRVKAMNSEYGTEFTSNKFTVDTATN